jgi:hypothetical protein
MDCMGGKVGMMKARDESSAKNRLNSLRVVLNGRHMDPKDRADQKLCPCATLLWSELWKHREGSGRHLVSLRVQEQLHRMEEGM